MNEISFDLLVVDQSQHSRRKKRQATNTTAPTFDPMASNFSLALVTSGCRTYDESTNQWVDSGCQVTYLNVLPSGKYPSNTVLFHFFQIYCSICLFQVLTISMRVILFWLLSRFWTFQPLMRQSVAAPIPPGLCLRQPFTCHPIKSTSMRSGPNLTRRMRQCMVPSPPWLWYISLHSCIWGRRTNKMLLRYLNVNE